MKLYTLAVTETTAMLVWESLLNRGARESYQALKEIEQQLVIQGAFVPPPTAAEIIAAEVAKRTPPTVTPNDPATHPETFIDTTSTSGESPSVLQPSL